MNIIKTRPPIWQVMATRPAIKNVVQAVVVIALAVIAVIGASELMPSKPADYTRAGASVKMNPLPRDLSDFAIYLFRKFNDPQV